MIFIIREMSEKLINRKRDIHTYIHICFIDLEKAFKRVRREERRYGRYWKKEE